MDCPNLITATVITTGSRQWLTAVESSEEGGGAPRLVRGRGPRTCATGYVCFTACLRQLETLGGERDLSGKAWHATGRTDTCNLAVAKIGGGRTRMTDVLGLKGVSDSVRIATQGFVAGASALLSRLCLPGAEELGLALRDRISAWRARNITRMLSRANDMYMRDVLASERDRLSPRLVHIAMEEASWIDDDGVQSMWSGLLAASATPGSESDENLVFMTLLRQLTALQARVVNLAVERAPKALAKNGLVVPGPTPLVEVVDMLRMLEVEDLDRVDRELDHLRELGLLGFIGGGGIDVVSGQIDLTPTPLALHLYIRGRGSRLAPAKYWELGASIQGKDQAAAD